MLSLATEVPAHVQVVLVDPSGCAAPAFVMGDEQRRAEMVAMTRRLLIAAGFSASVVMRLTPPGVDLLYEIADDLGRFD